MVTVSIVAENLLFWTVFVLPPLYPFSVYISTILGLRTLGTVGTYVRKRRPMSSSLPILQRSRSVSQQGWIWVFILSKQSFVCTDCSLDFVAGSWVFRKTCDIDKTIVNGKQPKGLGAPVNCEPLSDITMSKLMSIVLCGQDFSEE